MNLSEVLAAYGDRLFLSGDELREYSNGRDGKKMMVFVAWRDKAICGTGEPWARDNDGGGIYDGRGV